MQVFESLEVFRNGSYIGRLRTNQKYFKPNSNYIAEIAYFTGSSVTCMITDVTHPAAAFQRTYDAVHFFDTFVPIETHGETVSKPKACECGGHKAGFKDYTRQHSAWCPVYKA